MLPYIYFIIAPYLCDEWLWHKEKLEHSNLDIGFNGVSSACLKGLWVLIFLVGAIRKWLAPVAALVKSVWAGEVRSLIWI